MSSAATARHVNRGCRLPRAKADSRSHLKPVQNHAAVPLSDSTIRDVSNGHGKHIKRWDGTWLCVIARTTSGLEARACRTVAAKQVLPKLRSPGILRNPFTPRTSTTSLARRDVGWCQCHLYWWIGWFVVLSVLVGRTCEAHGGKPELLLLLKLLWERGQTLQFVYW